MTRFLKVRATRTFNAHAAGDVLLLEGTPEVERLVDSRLFEVVEIVGPFAQFVPDVEGTAELDAVLADDASAAKAVVTKAKAKPKTKAKAKRDAKTGKHV